MKNEQVSKVPRKKVLPYLFDKVTGTFSGFLIGMWASGLVSQFFETKSFKNIWGLSSKKTVVSKSTFGFLEWIAAALVGYIVFEFAMKFIKNKIIPRTSNLRYKMIKLIVKNGYKDQMRAKTYWR
jgi:glycerol uptake facilitator-like aquaporin